MGNSPMIVAAFAAVSTVAFAATNRPIQLPMNSFDEAYYICDNGGAFLISYDANSPANATVTTSNDNRRNVMKRTSVATGFQFAGDGAKFWTDGKSVVVEGTQAVFRNCKIKPS